MCCSLTWSSGDRLAVCVWNEHCVLTCLGDSSELTLGLFYLVFEILFVFLLIRDCRFVYCSLLI